MRSAQYWKALIERKTSERVTSHIQFLESGPAADAKVNCNIFQIGILHSVTLFSIPGILSEEIIQDIIAHAGSGGVSAAVLTSPDFDELIFFSDEAKADLYWLKTLFRSSGLPQDSLQEYHIQDLIGIISRYLTELKKELSGWLYRKDGETSASVRELTIQILMNRIILTRIFQVHGVEDPSESTILMNALSSFASTLPVLDFYDIRARPYDEETREEVRRLASLPVKELKKIRLSWVKPEDWATAFSRYLSSLPQKQHKKKHFQNEEEREWKDDVLKSGVGKLIAGILTNDESLAQRFWDPSAGCGQLIALILRRIRITLIEGGKDTITARLIAAGEMVHANDASPIHVAVVRFVMASWILSGECTDPSLTKTTLWYPFFALNRQIRAGSPLYDERTLEEFVSLQNGYPILRHLHPINIEEYADGTKPFSLIISCPEGKSPDSPPEVACYLTRRFTSYTAGVDQGVLYAELAGEFLAPGGKAIIFLRRNWLSESSFRGFRRWIAHTSSVTMVVPEDEPCLGDADDLSAMILHSDLEKLHTVIRFASREGHSGFQIRKYKIFPADLHKDDGWGLQDPWEKRMIDQLSQETMTLSEYLFDELYPGSTGYQIRDQADCWTSIKWTGYELSICSGITPEPSADVIIPGNDQFLNVLLHSSIIRWYITTCTRSAHTSPNLMGIIRTLPIRAIDHYSREETGISELIRTVRVRQVMLEKKKHVCHAWHDISRIERQISEVQQEIDFQICVLYGISPDDCIEIRQRMKTA